MQLSINFMVEEFSSSKISLNYGISNQNSLKPNQNIYAIFSRFFPSNWTSFGYASKTGTNFNEIAKSAAKNLNELVLLLEQETKQPIILDLYSYSTKHHLYRITKCCNTIKSKYYRTLSANELRILGEEVKKALDI